MIGPADRRHRGVQPGAHPVDVDLHLRGGDRQAIDTGQRHAAIQLHRVAVVAVGAVEQQHRAAAGAQRYGSATQRQAARDRIGADAERGAAGIGAAAHREVAGDGAGARHLQRAVLQLHRLHQGGIGEQHVHAAGAHRNALIHGATERIDLHLRRAREREAAPEARQGGVAAGQQRITGLAQRIRRQHQAQRGAAQRHAIAGVAELAGDSRRADQHLGAIGRHRALDGDGARNRAEAAQGKACRPGQREATVGAEAGGGAACQRQPDRPADGEAARQAAAAGPVAVQPQLAAGIAQPHEGRSGGQGQLRAGCVEQPAPAGGVLAQGQVQRAGQRSAAEAEIALNRKAVGIDQLVEHQLPAVVEREAACGLPGHHGRVGAAHFLVQRERGGADVAEADIAQRQLGRYDRRCHPTAGAAGFLRVDQRQVGARERCAHRAGSGAEHHVATGDRQLADGRAAAVRQRQGPGFQRQLEVAADGGHAGDADTDRARKVGRARRYRQRQHAARGGHQRRDIGAAGVQPDRDLRAGEADRAVDRGAEVGGAEQRDAGLPCAATKRGAGADGKRGRRVACGQGQVAEGEVRREIARAHQQVCHLRTTVHAAARGEGEVAGQAAEARQGQRRPERRECLHRVAGGEADRAADTSDGDGGVHGATERIGREPQLAGQAGTDQALQGDIATGRNRVAVAVHQHRQRAVAEGKRRALAWVADPRRHIAGHHPGAGLVGARLHGEAAGQRGAIGKRKLAIAAQRGRITAASQRDGAGDAGQATAQRTNRPAGCRVLQADGEAGVAACAGHGQVEGAGQPKTGDLHAGVDGDAAGCGRRVHPGQRLVEPCLVGGGLRHREIGQARQLRHQDLQSVRLVDRRGDETLAQIQTAIGGEGAAALTPGDDVVDLARGGLETLGQADLQRAAQLGLAGHGQLVVAAGGTGRCATDLDLQRAAGCLRVAADGNQAWRDDAGAGDGSGVAACAGQRIVGADGQRTSGAIAGIALRTIAADDRERRRPVRLRDQQGGDGRQGALLGNGRPWRGGGGAARAKRGASREQNARL